MSDINALFRSRVGIPQDEVLEFESLEAVLEKTAKAIPFENLCILENRTADITKENLVNKIMLRNEGGLCYELNTILFLFLLENGFKISLIRGVTYDQKNERWNNIGKTHVANVITFNDQLFIVDTGFGGNLPLKPVPLTGEVVISANGEFRVEQTDSEHGGFIFYMKLKHKDEDWKKGYAFNSKEIVGDIKELNEVQKIIVEHPESPFNKKPLVTILTNHGNRILTENSFIEWVDGNVERKEISEDQFKELAGKHFRIPSY